MIQSHHYKQLYNTTLKIIILEPFTFQWIPGHCDILGNKIADEIARMSSI